MRTQNPHINKFPVALTHLLVPYYLMTAWRELHWMPGLQRQLSCPRNKEERRNLVGCEE